MILFTDPLFGWTSPDEELLNILTFASLCRFSIRASMSTPSLACLPRTMLRRCPFSLGPIDQFYIYNNVRRKCFPYVSPCCLHDVSRGYTKFEVYRVPSFGSSRCSLEPSPSTGQMRGPYFSRSPSISASNSLGSTRSSKLVWSRSSRNRRPNKRGISSLYSLSRGSQRKTARVLWPDLP